MFWRVIWICDPLLTYLECFILLLALPLKMVHKKTDTDQDDKAGQVLGIDRRELSSILEGGDLMRKGSRIILCCSQRESMSEIYRGTDFEST